MVERLAAFMERIFGLSAERAVKVIHRTGVVLSAAAFVLIATVIVAFENVFATGDTIANLQVSDIVPQDVRSPVTLTYVSQVLTERERQAAMDSVRAVFDPPDPNIARQQVQLARQILDFIENVRRDPYGTADQKTGDVNQITALTLDTPVVQRMLALDEQTWQSVDTEVSTVLERMMREQIRETDIPAVLTQLPMQVSVRFRADDVPVITSVVSDLIRPNTFPNPQATEQQKLIASLNTPAESRSFERGQIVVREGTRLEDVDYEALNQLGLLKSTDRRLQEIVRALLTSTLVMVITGLYIARFRPTLFQRSRFLALLAAIFLIVLLGARLFSVGSQIYLYPTAAMGLLFVSIIGPEMAIVGTLGMALLIGLMADRSLEITTLVLLGGLIGPLTLRRSERLNSYFFAGLVVALTNVLVVVIFNLEMITTNQGPELSLLLVYSLVNGVLSAAASLAGMYLVTQAFNLPTSLKLVELSQPNQPLLQRLLREAPGTYQHSLQVANLSEQAANAIGANAELVRVAALYHDIGKMLNPAFFVENQADGVNPHDALDDPYRSADIIISHVTDGDRLARQYRLPGRIRDFILEHHGTTLVSYFYHQAMQRAEDKESVDIEQFTYPGPIPQTRESGIMMVADSCESTVRARKPANKQEIADIVGQIIDDRQSMGQLDDSGLTSKDIKTIRAIFVEMLQAVFHPRINYPRLPQTQGLARKPENGAEPVPAALPGTPVTLIPAPQMMDAPLPPPKPAEDSPTPEPTVTLARDSEKEETLVDDDDSPLAEVPPLRRTSDYPATRVDDKAEDN
jgi:cyclic-di-AMP phosphodiesterase PgpH